ncbi:MAG: biotin/lipoyl-binding protein, partial [Planctomycetota bacterium]
MGLTLLPAGRAVAQGPPEGPTSQPVAAARIFVKPRLEIRQTFVGTVLPRRVSQVGSTVEGRVIELFVEEGDHVNKGDKLAQLRTESLEIELASAEAELELLGHELERLNVAGPKEIEQAKARVAAAEALRDFTRARADRSTPLLANRTISKDDLEEIISAATGALEIHKERTAGWELAEATYPIDLLRAESKIEVQREKIRGLEDDIAEHTILAP